MNENVIPNVVKRPIILHDPGAKLSLGLQVDDHGILWMATSFCHRRDQFRKKTGMIKVMGRLVGATSVPIANALIPQNGSPCGYWCRIEVGQYFGTNPFKDVLEPIKTCLNSMTPEDRRHANHAYKLLLQTVNGVVNGRAD